MYGEFTSPTLGCFFLARSKRGASYEGDDAVKMIQMSYIRPDSSNPVARLVCCTACFKSYFQPLQIAMIFKFREKSREFFFHSKFR